jgi:hypothetical protein
MPPSVEPFLYNYKLRVYVLATKFSTHPMASKVALTNATNRGGVFFTEFVVKYWHAKHENRKCCPQHGAFNAPSVGLAFSVVTIAVSEPFLLPTA